jgi:hypothetical protein
MGRAVRRNWPRIAIEAKKQAAGEPSPLRPSLLSPNHLGDLRMLPLYAALGALASATVVCWFLDNVSNNEDDLL